MLYLADTLTNEKNLRQDTKTIKETLKDNLEDLKGKVGEATLNAISKQCQQRSAGLVGTWLR